MVLWRSGLSPVKVPSFSRVYLPKAPNAMGAEHKRVRVVYHAPRQMRFYGWVTMLGGLSGFFVQGRSNKQVEYGSAL